MENPGGMELRGFFLPDFQAAIYFFMVWQAVCITVLQNRFEL
jgi:hypothetical protein